MFSKDSAVNGAETIIGPSIKVKGGLVGGGDIMVGGKVEGSITTQHNLTVAEKAEVDADVKAANAQVAGFIKGNVSVSGKLELAATSKILGNIAAKVLVVAEGAQISGNCQTGLGEKTEPTPETALRPKPASATPTA